MEKTITLEDAKNRKKVRVFLMSGSVNLTSNTLEELLAGPDYVVCEKYIGELLHGNCDVMQYCINNVVSSFNSPRWLGSLACDLCYRYKDIGYDKSMVSNAIGFIISELWFFDHIDDNGDLVIVEGMTKETRVELFLYRLYKWFLEPLGHDQDEWIKRYK